MVLEYLKQGISLGCQDSMGSLGIAYHKGIIVDKDDKKAEEWLKKAIKLGSIIAQRYYIIEFQDLIGKTTECFKRFAEVLEKGIEDAKPKPVKVGKKINPNEKCSCGSGKKYKKCCRNLAL